MRKILSIPVAIFLVSAIAILTLFVMYPPGPYLINWSTASASLLEPVFGTKVEAQSPQRLQIQAILKTNAGSNRTLEVICDTVTGTLVYRTYSGGLWGDNKNDCRQNPR